MEFDVKKKKILEVLANHKLAVIATVDNNNPEAALIGFNYFDNLELTFGTFESFRKYKNLKANPHAAFVIGWNDSVTVQYEGIVKELHGTELKECQDKYLEKYPTAAKYIHNSRERFFKVTPTWIRYTNLSVQPEEILEIKY